MYDEMEVKISGKYLVEVLAAMDEPIVVLGGWAVRFLVNDRYRENTGRDYLGSRDIDLGFHITGDIENSAFAKAMGTLERHLGFINQSFRFFKETHSETGVVLTVDEAKKLPPYLIFPMYVDLIVDTIPPGFKERFGFSPIDEPLIVSIFTDGKNRIVREEFGKTLWLPTAELMLAMKVKSHPSREKEHKRVKDICDITAILLFGTLSGEKVWPDGHLSPEDVEKFRKAITRKDTAEAAGIIGIDASIVENAFARFGLAPID
jgi:hypothetical protein